jgi:hypothetical protein
VQNTTTKTEVYSMATNTVVGVPAGTLGDDKSLRIIAKCRISFASIISTLSVWIAYGSVMEKEVTFYAKANTPVTEAGLIIEALLSAINSSSFQKLHLCGSIELPIVDWGGNPTSHVGGTEDSSSDQDLKIFFEWSVADAGNIAVMEHVSVEVLGDPLEVEAGLSDAPMTQVLSMSLINRLPQSLYRKLNFYGEFTHHLDHTGIGTATIVRGTAQNATWRDGAAHSVAANLPRFEYSGSTPLGLLINSAVSETFTIPIANNLNGANTLFWRENNVNKHTTLNTNPFNGSGVWTGTNNIHVSHIMGFNAVLSADEISLVDSIYTNYL